MAEQFLAQLLRMENSVQSDESQQCYICMSDYGTLSQETGIIECQIRLPCDPNHTFGSACIATWLKSSNTCPMCPHKLFPSLGDDVDEDVADGEGQLVRQARTTTVSNEADNERDLEFQRAQAARAALISGFVLSYSATLHLNDSVTQCSRTIGEGVRGLISLRNHSEASIAAASVYLASHLRRQPRALREISQLAGSSEGTIQSIYRRIYAYHHSMPPYLWHPSLRNSPDQAPGEDRSSARSSATWPPLEHEFVDGEDSEDEEFIQAIWSRFSTELRLEPAVTIMARRIAFKLETWPAFAFREPKSLIPISIYVALCIAGDIASHVPIADVAGFSASYLVSTYREIYADRERLLDNSMDGVVLPVLPESMSTPF